jgi:hypothetical protein
MLRRQRRHGEQPATWQFDRRNSAKIGENGGKSAQLPLIRVDCQPGLNGNPAIDNTQ